MNKNRSLSQIKQFKTLEGGKEVKLNMCTLIIKQLYSPLFSLICLYFCSSQFMWKIIYIQCPGRVSQNVHILRKIYSESLMPIKKIRFYVKYASSFSQTCSESFIFFCTHICIYQVLLFIFDILKFKKKHKPHLCSTDLSYFQFQIVSLLFHQCLPHNSCNSHLPHCWEKIESVSAYQRARRLLGQRDLAT